MVHFCKRIEEMSKNYAIQAEARDVAGKGAARALRRESKVPGVIYGDGKEPVKITLPAKEINLEYKKGHMFTTLCDLDVNGEKHLVLARDVQTHVVKEYVMHVDFLRVTPKAKIAINIPVHFINEEECPGLVAKGSLNIVRHEVEMVCQATNIPEAIEVDLTPFNIGDAIKISDVKLPQGAKPVIERDFTIATIVEPRAIEVTDEEAEGAEATEGAEGEAGGEKAEGEAKEE